MIAPHPKGNIDIPEVAILPPQEAYDYGYMANRLLEPELLAKAVAVRALLSCLLAVPVGRRRRAGMLGVTTLAVGSEIVAALHGLPGFPDIRLTQAQEPPGTIAVEWGELLPEGVSDQARSLLYGLRDKTASTAPPPPIHRSAPLTWSSSWTPRPSCLPSPRKRHSSESRH